MKDSLSIAVTDHKQREELRKLKDAVNTMVKYEEADRHWDLDKSTRDAFKQKRTMQTMQTMSNHQIKLIVMV